MIDLAVSSSMSPGGGGMKSITSSNLRSGESNFGWNVELDILQEHPLIQRFRTCPEKVYCYLNFECFLFKQKIELSSKKRFLSPENSQTHLQQSEFVSHLTLISGTRRSQKDDKF